MIENLGVAIIASLKRAQELTYQYSKALPKGESLWYEVPFWKRLDKATAKSLWRKYSKN